MRIFETIGILAFASLLFCFGSGKTKQMAAAMTSGNPEAGRHEIEYYGCASCHVVPGVPGAQGLIGPSLKQFACRNYIGGVLKNSPDNLVQWIQNAPAIDPKTAMPDLQIPEQQAHDIAGYLYTLK